METAGPGQVSGMTSATCRKLFDRRKTSCDTLLRQRADIMKRIGTVKQTIAGLANLFGDGVLNEELMELVDRKSSGRQPGFTKACRMILMEAGRAMSARDICDYFQQKMPSLLAHHKDPMASVTTVLNRLVDYGEAQAVVANNGRTSVAVGGGGSRPEPVSSERREHGIGHVALVF